MGVSGGEWERGGGGRRAGLLGWREVLVSCFWMNWMHWG